MGFRFRKSIRILPGVRLNLSKSGVSTSIGGRGATINVGKKGVRGTVGLPGTGLSYSEMLTRKSGAAPARDRQDWVDDSGARSGGAKGSLVAIGVIVLAVVAVLFIAGLMSARQTGPSGTFDPQSATKTLPATTSDAAQAGDAAHVDDVVNCRANPTARGKIVAKVTPDDELETIGQQGEWIRVTSGDQDCWVSAGLVKR